MKNTIFNNKKIIIVTVLLLTLIFTLSLSSNIIAKQDKMSETIETVQNIDIATNMIQDKKYDEAIKVLNRIDDVDFYYLKNQHLGDIAFLNRKYDEAVSFYNIAQFHSKDKVMHDYMSKKMAYIITVKNSSLTPIQ